MFEAKAVENNAPIVFAEDTQEVIQVENELNGRKHYTTVSYGDINGELAGEYQQKNTNTVLHVVKLLKDMHVIDNDDCVRVGFSNVCESTGLMGRWQTLGTSPLVVCDTGHNVGGWQYLSHQIKAVECKTLRIVFGMVDDKDIEHVMDMLPKNAVYYFAQATTHRAIPCERSRRKGSGSWPARHMLYICRGCI